MLQELSIDAEYISSCLYLIKYPVTEIPNYKQRRGYPESPGINVLDDLFFVPTQTRSL